MGLTLLAAGVSCAIWATAIWSMGRATAIAVAAAPASWRERFAADYERALALRLRDFVLSPRTLWALASWVAAFVVLDLVGVILAVQLAAAAVYAAVETARDRREARERHRAAVAEGMDPLPPNRRVRWWLYGSLFAGQAGFLAAACFLAWAALG
jgi:uncharacterized membrane protein